MLPYVCPSVPHTGLYWRVKLQGQPTVNTRRLELSLGGILVVTLLASVVTVVDVCVGGEGIKSGGGPV